MIHINTEDNINSCQLEVIYKSYYLQRETNHMVGLNLTLIPERKFVNQIYHFVFGYIHRRRMIHINN